MAKASKPQGPGAIEQLAKWVLAQRAQDLSAATLNQTKLLLLDTVGCGFAAAGMGGRTMGLGAGPLGQALALSGARSITPLAVRHGDISAAKSVANALVAQNGMQATILAKHGMTGPLDLFENQHGLKSVFPGLNWVGALTAPLTADSYIMSCHVKAYPCLATGQGLAAAELALHSQL